MFAELRSATRGLRRWRASAFVTLTLAAGIATTTALYGVSQVLVADLPGVPAIERVGRIYAASATLGVERGLIALNEFDAGLAQAASFQAIGAYVDQDAVVGSGLEAQPLVAGYASPAFFTAMGVPPAAGRVFSEADLQGPPVVVLSETLWRRQFPDGRMSSATLMVDGVERAVIGVMPANFRYPFVGVSADLWVPLAHTGRERPAIVSVYGRLRDGVEWTGAQAELTAHSRRGTQWALRVIPIIDDTRSRAVKAYAGTLGPAFLVLLIACVNVACLLMARGVERDKELTVRRALGATRIAIVRLLLLEHAVLAVVSGALGSALAAGILRAIAAQLAPFEPQTAAALAADLRLLPVALASSALACLLFGVIPALRLSTRNVAASLNGIPSPHRIPIRGYGARDVIVFAEIACAVGFVVWTAMLYTLFAGIHAMAPAFPADHVVAMRVRTAGAADAAARVAAVPGVVRTTVSSGMIGGSPERVESNGAEKVVSRIPVGDGFFDVLGLTMVRGRSFDAGELRGQAHVAVLGESAARRLARGGDAIGLTLRTHGRPALTVIGVCRDAIDYGVLADVDVAGGEMYVPYEPSMWTPEAVVLARLAGDAHRALGGIAAAAGAPAGERPPRPIVLSDDLQRRDGGSLFAVVGVLGWFAVLTLLLAAGGVFAVVSQSVAQRTRELAVRLAIGATPGRVLRLVLAREMKLIGAAVATGVVFTVLGTHALFVELTRLSAIQPAMWIAALLLSGGAAAIAVAFATFRIVRLEPADVLRRS